MLEEEQLLEEERLDRSKYREFSSRFILSCFVLLELPSVQHQVTRDVLSTSSIMICRFTSELVELQILCLALLFRIEPFPV